MRIIRHIRDNYRKFILAATDILLFSILNSLFYAAASLSAPDAAALYGSDFAVNSAVLLAAILIVRSGLNVYRTVWRYTEVTPKS